MSKIKAELALSRNVTAMVNTMSRVVDNVASKMIELALGRIMIVMVKNMTHAVDSMVGKITGFAAEGV